MTRGIVLLLSAPEIYSTVGLLNRNKRADPGFFFFLLSLTLQHFYFLDISLISQDMMHGSCGWHLWVSTVWCRWRGQLSLGGGLCSTECHTSYYYHNMGVFILAEENWSLGQSCPCLLSAQYSVGALRWVDIQNAQRAVGWVNTGPRPVFWPCSSEFVILI